MWPVVPVAGGSEPRSCAEAASTPARSPRACRAPKSSAGTREAVVGTQVEPRQRVGDLAHVRAPGRPDGGHQGDDGVVAAGVGHGRHRGERPVAGQVLRVRVVRQHPDAAEERRHGTTLGVRGQGAGVVGLDADGAERAAEAAARLGERRREGRTGGLGRQDDRSGDVRLLERCDEGTLSTGRTADDDGVGVRSRLLGTVLRGAALRCAGLRGSVLAVGRRGVGGARRCAGALRDRRGERAEVGCARRIEDVGEPDAGRRPAAQVTSSGEAASPSASCSAAATDSVDGAVDQASSPPAA